MDVNVKLSIFAKNSPAGHDKFNFIVTKRIYHGGRHDFKFTDSAL